MIDENGKLITVWTLETTYTSGTKELNGIYETEEKAQEDANWIRARKGEGDIDGNYIIEKQEITEYFVL